MLVSYSLTLLSKSLIWLGIVVLSIFTPYSYAEISVVDDTGAIVSLKQPAQRIISLSPSLTELTFAAGGQYLLKSVVNYSDYPPAAIKIPQVGNHNAIDIERLVSLNPDLVLVWKSGNPPLQISKIQQLGIPIFTSEPDEFDDIPSTILRLGTLMNTEVTARKNAEDFRQKLENLKKRFPQTSASKKSVFIQIWDQPLMTISGRHLISKIVEQCNGENIFHDATPLSLTVDIETVLQLDPDVILATKKAEPGESWLNRWNQWEFLSAVKHQRLYRVNPDEVVRHTPRIIEGIENVCEVLHSVSE